MLSALTGEVDAFATQQDGSLVPAGVKTGLPTASSPEVADRACP